MSWFVSAAILVFFVTVAVIQMTPSPPLTAWRELPVGEVRFR